MENKSVIIHNDDHLCISPLLSSQVTVFYDYYQVVTTFFYSDFFTYKNSISSTELLHTVAKQSCVLVFYCCVKSHYKLRGFKTILIYQFTVVQVRSPHGINWVLYLGSHQSRCQPGQPGPAPTWGRICFQAHSGDWWNSVPYSSRTTAPVPLLAVGPKPLSLTAP